MRPVAALLVLLPVSAIGWLSAHSLAYRALDAHADEGLHGYLRYAPLAAAALACALVAGLALAAWAAWRGRRLRPPAWPFGLLAPVGFAVQEHLERLAHDGTFPAAAALEPTFVVGLLLQIPFALAALALARGLLAATAALVRACRPPRSRIAPLPAWWQPTLAVRPLPRVSGSGRGPRAPPGLPA
jgi:hypothetical protein